MNNTRIGKAIARRLSGLVLHISNNFIYKYRTPKNFSDTDAVANILIVKNVKYIKIASTCIKSFLYFHPKACINVHCDAETYGKARSLERIKRVKVLVDCYSEDSWQVSKLKLFLKLSGTNQILMDADLKWNGPLPDLEKVTYFVREFTFKDKKPYEELFSLIGWGHYSGYSMKNTSFVMLNNYVYPKDAAYRLTQRIALFEKTILDSYLDASEKASLIRIAEQVILSLEFDDRDCSFLKESDKQFDGAFVESSYFGATGTRFGWLGITSR